MFIDVNFFTKKGRPFELFEFTVGVFYIHTNSMEALVEAIKFYRLLNIYPCKSIYFPEYLLSIYRQNEIYVAGEVVRRDSRYSY